MRRPLLSVAAVLAGAAASVGQPVAPAPREVPPAFPDAVELVYHTAARPVRLRVVVTLGGQSLGAAWRERVRAVFDLADRDRDGFLNADETRRSIPAGGAAALIAGGTFNRVGDPTTVAQLDTDGDGKVSFAEFEAAYRAAVPGPVAAPPPVIENAANVALTAELFKLLDTNNDGKLARDEVTAAEKLLATLDADEDECLTAAELFPLTGRPGVVRAVQPAQGLQPAFVIANPLLDRIGAYPVGKIPGTVTQRLLRHFDKNDDYELTPAESGFDADTFRRLDADGDGTLTGEELDAWRTGPADVEVVLSFSPDHADCRAELSDAGAASRLGIRVRKPAPHSLVLSLGRQDIDFTVGLAGSSVRLVRQPLRASFNAVFQLAAGGKGYVEEKDLNGANAAQFQFLRPHFESADLDGNGKLTKDELDRYQDVQYGLAEMSLTAATGVRTPTLFQMLDANSDGRLSVRELRTAWGRLIPLEPGGSAITAASLQPTVSLRLTRRTEQFIATQIVVAGVNPQPFATPAAPTRGPLWFRKMDRNADGDVSRAEFLGAKAEFDAIDTDRDGLVSAEEAEAFDRKARK